MDISTPDLTAYHAVHTALRAAPHRMADAVATIDPMDGRRTGAFARYWKGFAGEVLAHHTIEDVSMFPDLLARLPDVQALFDRTDDDHQQLDRLMDACGDAVARLAAGVVPNGAERILRELAVHMDEHLDFEDAEILPLFEEHYTAEEYQALDEAAVKSIGIGPQAAFTIPFVLSSVAPEDRARMMAGAPLPLIVLYRLTKGRFARLEARALGSTAQSVVPVEVVA
jgi:hemerythrin-like domain-containing protein